MQSDLTRLGEFLKKSREERNLSLKEIENATSIRIALLQSIEEGQFGQLISPVYAQGFIKKYLNFLGLDADKLLQGYPQVLNFLNEKRVDNPDSMFLGSFEVRGSPGGEVKWLPNLVWVAVSAVGLLVLWFFARYVGIF